MSVSSFTRNRVPAGLPRLSNKRVGLLLGGGIAAGLMAGVLANAGHVSDVLGLVTVLIGVLIWRRPQIGPLVLMVAALLIEQAKEVIEPTLAGQFGGSFPTTTIPITNKIPLFDGLGSLHLEPADLLLAFLLIVYLVKCAEWGPRWWPSSRVAISIATMLGFVVYGLVLGQLHGGQVRESLQEVRPFVYLGAAYLVTSVLIRSRSALHMMLWGYVIAETIKACQGLYVFWQTRNWNPKPDNVLSHEEALFFSIYILLVAGLWMFNQRGRLRTVATRLLPLIVFVDLVNNRRTAWLVLGGAMLTMAAIGYVQLPNRRHLLNRVLVILLVFSCVYFPAFWNSTGTLGSPAAALRSEFSPNLRDQQSDVYRVEEDANLQYNIKNDGGPLGEGFGVRINYAIPIVNIRKSDPYLNYIPHNGVLYLMMRLGILGSTAFWAMIAAGIIAGCRLAKTKEREIAMVGALSACALVGYALDGATDQGFYFYRIALIMGCLLGLAEAGRRLVATSRPAPPSGGAREAEPTVVEAPIEYSPAESFSFSFSRYEQRRR